MNLRNLLLVLLSLVIFVTCKKGEDSVVVPVPPKDFIPPSKDSIPPRKDSIPPSKDTIPTPVPFNYDSLNGEYIGTIYKWDRSQHPVNLGAVEVYDTLYNQVQLLTINSKERTIKFGDRWLQTDKSTFIGAKKVDTIFGMNIYSSYQNTFAIYVSQRKIRLYTSHYVFYGLSAFTLLEIYYKKD